MAKNNKFRLIFETVAGIVLVLVCVAVIYGIQKGILSSQDAFVNFVKSAGVFSPIAFVIIETITVVILILPCALGYPVSVVAFGPFWGFVLNAVSTVLGSLIIFVIVRVWGKPIVEGAVKKRQFEKYEKFMDRTVFFEKVLAVVLLLPVMPDNVFCYLAGLTKITFRRFLIIVVLFKPWNILAYTYGSQFFLDKFSHLWSYAGDLIFNVGRYIV